MRCCFLTSWVVTTVFFLHAAKATPTPEPTPYPTIAPSPEPTFNPTNAPTDEPTVAPVTPNPTPYPTSTPTPAPTDTPTASPTPWPTVPTPTENPTENPTEVPTENPTEVPTENPTENPTEVPTENPTEKPTEVPTENPTENLTEVPTENPTENPTEFPTENPTDNPTEVFVEVVATVSGITELLIPDTSRPVAASLDVPPAHVTVASYQSRRRRLQAEATGRWEITYRVRADSLEEAEGIASTVSSEEYANDLAQHISSQLEVNAVVSNVAAEVLVDDSGDAGPEPPYDCTQHTGDQSSCVAQSTCEYVGNACSRVAIASGTSDVDYFDIDVVVQIVIDPATMDTVDDSVLLAAALEALGITTESDEANTAELLIDTDTSTATVTFNTNDLNVEENVITATAAGGSFTTSVSSALASAGSTTTVSSAASSTTTTLSGNEAPAVPTTNEDSLVAECTEGEHLLRGYVTGQLIEMNYEATTIKTNVAGNTMLEVHFTVPLRYSVQYQAASFAISWHNRADDSADKTGCYTNRGSLADPYPNCPVSSTWEATRTSENPCFDDYTKEYSWTDIINGLFRAPQTQNDGTVLEAYFVADVEQWAFYDSSSFAGDFGREGYNEWGAVSNKGVGYSQHFEGRNTDFDWRSINIIDERYTFSQIPFTLRFPLTVIVDTTFQAGTTLTMLAGVVKQDTIRINFNPSTDDGHFAYVDVHVLTEVQYPYGLRSYKDTDEGGHAKAEIILTDGKGNVEQSDVSWLNMDHPSSCGGVKQGRICQQVMEFRIKPNTCEANSDYRVKAYAKCVVSNDGCSVDDFWKSTNEVTRETSNAYVTFDFEVRTGDFCPEVVDEYRIVATPEIWLNEGFESLGGNNDLVAEGGNVFSNDWIFFKFNYAGYSSSMPNGVDDASKDVIDFSRAIKVFMDVELPSVPVSQGGNFDDGLLPASIDSDITAMDFVTIPGHTMYQVLLCETTYTTADYPIRNNNQNANLNTGELIDCFNEKIFPNAQLYLDVQPIFMLETPATVGQKEIAFGFRLDERIIPVDRYNNENTKVAVTVEAEVYWTGNKHPSRRRLQGIDSQEIAGPRTTSSRNIASTTFKTRARDLDAEFCELSYNLRHVHMDLYMAYKPGHGPKSMMVTDFAGAFQYHVADILGVHSKKIWVDSITEGEDAMTFTRSPAYLTTSSNRRLQGTTPSYFNVRLQIFSDHDKTAGRNTNYFQALVIDKNSRLYSLSIFEGAQIYKMTIDECGAIPVVPKKTSHLGSETSGSPLRTVVASVFLALFTTLL